MISQGCTATSATPPAAPSTSSRPASAALIHPSTRNGHLDASSLPSQPASSLPTPAQILSDPERTRLSNLKNDVEVEALSGGLVVKRGRGLRVELVAIEWLKEKLGERKGEVPMPQYRGFYTQEGVDYLFFTRVPGESLELHWPSLSPSARQSILAQLRDILRTLRSFTAPFLGRLNETQSYQLPWRPSTAYRSWEEWARALKSAAGVEKERWEQGGDLEELLQRPGWASFSSSASTDQGPPPLGVLTHGDLAARNILISSPPSPASCPPSRSSSSPEDRPPPRILALLDWECLEFAPPELEYLRARREVEKGWTKGEAGEAARAILEVVREVSVEGMGGGEEKGRRLERSWEWYGRMVM
ncbi:hypothetical protein JCM8097_001280 [Rhodosporidiobolus ruineniae]